MVFICCPERSIATGTLLTPNTPLSSLPVGSNKGLVTNDGEGGGYKTGGGGHVKFYPYEKGGGVEKSFSHAEGGAQKVVG